MGFFDSFRDEGYPTRYNDYRTAAKIDILETVVLTIFTIFVIAFIFILPGIRGIQRLYSFLRVFFSIFVTMVILLTNCGMGWRSAEVSSRMQYKAGTNQLVNGTIGMWFGLKGVNITLIVSPQDQIREHVYYNEHFSWAWSQGKVGFGPDAGTLQTDYYKSKKRGTPYPIIWAAEYLIHDGNGFRYGRYYRIAGWYAHMFLWLSFPLWLLSNVLMFMVIRYGAIFMGLSGSSMLISCLIYAFVKNPGPGLMIPFEGGQLEPTLGWCFYLIFGTGVICMIISLIILLLDLRYPEFIASFFGVKTLQDYEEFYIEYDEVNEQTNPKKVNEPSSNKVNEATNVPQSKQQLLLRKRSTSMRFQKSSHKRNTQSPPLKIVSETPTYENVVLKRIDTPQEELVENSGSQEKIL